MKLGKNVILFAMVSIAIPASANLVSNGGFETGNFSGWTTTPAGAGSSFSVLASGHSGTYGAWFQANQGQHDQIAQVLATTASQQYHVSFWVENLGVEDDSLEVWWEGAIALNRTPLLTELESWVLLEFDISATQNGSELRFKLHDAQSGIGLDDISVTPVPEPVTIAGLGLGLAALLRRRK